MQSDKHDFRKVRKLPQIYEGKQYNTSAILTVDTALHCIALALNFFL